MQILPAALIGASLISKTSGQSQPTGPVNLDPQFGPSGFDSNSGKKGGGGGSGVGQTLSTALTGVSILSDVAGGIAQKQQFDAKAKTLDFQAKQQRITGKADEINAQRELNRALANTLVTAGASNIGFSGSVAAGANQIVRQGDFQIGLLRRGSEINALSSEQGARNARSKGRAARNRGILKGVTTGLFAAATLGARG